MKLSTITSRLHAEFERPTTGLGKLFHAGIIGLILLSAITLIIEYAKEDLYQQYKDVFMNIDAMILMIFTAEYVVRLIVAPHKWKFVSNFYNVIDLIAISPAFISVANLTGIRSVRLFRLARFARIIRVFRIFRYGKFAGALFNIRHTILEKILPVITTFTVLKFCIFLLEDRGFWIQDYDLETMFAVVGFVIGIILSQKIGVAYTKFILLEDAVTRIHGFIISIHTVLKHHHEGHAATRVMHKWTDTFQNIVLRQEPKRRFYEINEALYREIHELIVHSPAYAELIRIYSRLNEEASFILNRMDALTPSAYNQILHRATLIYSLMLVIFVPGVTGIISTIVSTYVLYGMYQVTDDMDNAMTHLEDHLINADISDLGTLKEQLQPETPQAY